MTPKEKAKELIEKYSDLEKYNESEYAAFNLNLTKKASLIAVEEIIQSWIIDGNKRLDKGIIYYWEAVKKEIDNL